MEKRLILAVLLMSGAIMLTNVLFPPPEPVPAPTGADSAVVASEPPPAAAAAALPVAPTPAGAVAADTVVVTSGLYRYAFSTQGASLVSAELLEYPSYARAGEPVQLVPAGVTAFLAHRLVVGADTIDLSRYAFQTSEREVRVEEGTGEQSLHFSFASEDGFGVEIAYTFHPDRYTVGVQGRVSGLGERTATLLTDLGPGPALNEAYEHHSEQQLAVVSRTSDEVSRLNTAKVDGTHSIAQPLSWVGLKDKYFLAAVIAGEERPLAGARVAELPDTELHFPQEDRSIQVPHAKVTTALPLQPDGGFALQAYLGPQDYGRLAAVGYDLENVTQYAYRWLEPVIRPVAAAILWVLGALHSTLGIAYGWVLVLFGVLMRLVLWPLNAKAMRAQMKNMAVQPLMMEIREKYKTDPQRQQQEMLKLYKEHGFNPFAGCLPLLVPFPVLITLFFVFQNTIAFRGAEFLWLPDLSLRDPLYILPVFLMVSMFALQLISARVGGMEQNPQMKMMMYVMPLMMGILFFSLPAGLNLYYATTNVASIPQQMLIARERQRAQAELKKKNAPKVSASPAGSAQRRKRRA